MNILGINAYHGDSSSCLVQDGKLIAAAEEERFSRIKHWAGFPIDSIRYCLNEAGLSINQIDHVAINSDPKAHLLKKIGYSIKNRPDIRMILDRINNKHKRANVEIELLAAFPDNSFSGKVHHIEHHLAHLASAHLVSPFKDSIAISVDGFGDFSSSAWGVCQGSQIDIDKRIFFPHSLGVFYQALTQFIGFPHYGDEYKVMGLAPYGKPVFLEKMRDIVLLNNDGTFKLNLKYFLHHVTKVNYEWSGGSPVVGNLYNSKELESLLGLNARKPEDELKNIHYDLANSIQAMYEEAFFNILEASYNKYGYDRLTLAGGCAMNSVANGKVYRRSSFKKVYIQSAAGDAGGAIGAAFIVANKLKPLKNRFYMDHAYWGPSFKNDYHEKLLYDRENELNKQGCYFELIDDEDKLCNQTAQAISNGLVIGWFQGRMEWGPRALGNRSILGDPRRSDMKDILNLKIKRRESFRPFAPSILRESVKDWFEEDDDVPFMMKVFQIKEEKRTQIPAVSHVDGSGRLQTVSSSTNSRYYKLISSFEEFTGVPILLNTSFNENEPVVCRPEEALNTFLRSKMDLLVLGNWLVKRDSHF
jgi:carbamoyltransferase